MNIEIAAYIMKYEGPLVSSELQLKNFEEKDYEEYKDVYHNFFTICEKHWV